MPAQQFNFVRPAEQTSKTCGSPEKTSEKSLEENSSFSRNKWEKQSFLSRQTVKFNLQKSQN